MYTILLTVGMRRYSAKAIVRVDDISVWVSDTIDTVGGVCCFWFYCFYCYCCCMVVRYIYLSTNTTEDSQIID